MSENQSESPAPAEESGEVFNPDTDLPEQDHQDPEGKVKPEQDKHPSDPKEWA